MFELITYLMNNPYAWFILSLIAIIGVILTIYYAIKSKRRINILFEKSENMIVGNINEDLEGLEVSYNNEVINDLSITKYTIWNNGNIKIEENDFASLSPFAIEANDKCRILNCSILSSSEETNLFSLMLDKDGNKINIKFEYIGVKDGVIIQVLHTGKSSGLHLEGKLKDGFAINYVYDNKVTIENRIFPYVLGMMYVGGLASSLIALFIKPILFWIISVILFIFCILIYRLHIKLKAKIPDNLR